MTTYLEPSAAETEIQSNVATIRGKPADETAAARLALYAKYFVAEVLDYCNRDDFPQALCMTGAEIIGRWLDDLENGGRSALKSIKQDDTEYQFAVSDASQAAVLWKAISRPASPAEPVQETEVAAMTPPWERCRKYLAKYMYRDKVTVTRQVAAVDEDGADTYELQDVYKDVPAS